MPKGETWAAEIVARQVCGVVVGVHIAHHDVGAVTLPFSWDGKVAHLPHLLENADLSTK